jgi:maltooligosyltrehalose trehalohydrolase
MSQRIPLGGTYLGSGRCHFLVWAPFAETVEVHLVAPEERSIVLEPGPRGYHHTLAVGVEPGSLYMYRLDGKAAYPDPASRYQPHDIHGPSQVLDTQFSWQDQGWYGVPLRQYIIYELHVGTFTAEGTFDAILPHVDELKALGITAVELMPIAQFPGNRNWGYDGVYPYAAQHAYGGPEGLKRLVNACHQQGLAVILDVVYNHLGPEGNYLGHFGPYFTERYKTPWGPALNFDGPQSDEVRRYFIDNALYWITACHIDALRLDAVHAIVDHSAYPFLKELAARVHEQAEQCNRRVYVIAESDLDDTRIIRAPEQGGYGHDAQWNDAFHHALHTLVTGERDGYYRDFGQVSHLAKAFAEGFVYSGQYSPFRQRRHGNSSRQIPAQQFVVCAQNHDQIGNRMLGERLTQIVSFEALKLAAAVTLLSPFIPLLFMGEEYGEPSPFPYFISHTDSQLIAAVQRGRREEFAAFAWQGEPPNPQSETVFQHAKLNHGLRHEGHHGCLLAFYQELIRLRQTVPALSRLDKNAMVVSADEKVQLLYVRRWSEVDEVVILVHFGQAHIDITLPVPAGPWHKRLDSAEGRWQGPGSALAEDLISDGEIRFSLPPQAVVLWHQDIPEERLVPRRLS